MRPTSWGRGVSLVFSSLENHEQEVSAQVTRVAQARREARWRVFMEGGGEVGGSGREAFDVPGVCGFAVEEAVVKAGGAALPEFDGLWDDAVSAPEGWEGDFAVGEFGADFVEFLEEDFARGDDFALVGDPGSDLGFAGAGGEVFEGFEGGDFFGAALEDDLAFEGDPGEEGADVGVLVDLLGLAAGVICKKNEAVWVEVF